MVVEISASLMGYPVAQLCSEIERLQTSSFVCSFHLDLTDGSRTLGPPNLTEGYLQSLEQARSLFIHPYDLHLMMLDPTSFEATDLLQNARCCYVPCETAAFLLDRLIVRLGSRDRLGLSIDPWTHPMTLVNQLRRSKLRQVLQMSVIPGNAGAPFIEGSEHRSQLLQKELGSDVGLMVDGGINAQTIPVFRGIVDRFVIGSGLSDDRKLLGLGEILSEWV